MILKSVKRFSEEIMRHTKQQREVTIPPQRSGHKKPKE